MNLGIFTKIFRMDFQIAINDAFLYQFLRRGRIWKYHYYQEYLIQGQVLKTAFGAAHTNFFSEELQVVDLLMKKKLYIKCVITDKLNGEYALNLVYFGKINVT
jgi:hypothetical protein